MELLNSVTFQNITWKVRILCPVFFVWTEDNLWRTCLKERVWKDEIKSVTKDEVLHDNRQVRKDSVVTEVFTGRLVRFEGYPPSWEELKWKLESRFHSRERWKMIVSSVKYLCVNTVSVAVKGAERSWLCVRRYKAWRVSFVSPSKISSKIFELVIQIPFIVNKYFQRVSHLT